MARVVSQVLSRPDRLTLIWSEGSTFFEPYHLTASLLEDLRDTVARITKALAEKVDTAPGAGDGARLAQMGSELYQQLFRVNAEDERTREIRQWLAGLEAAGALESIEILSDAPELVPWPLVCDRPDAEDGCWGTRLNLTLGRRADPLRQISVLEKPEVLLAIDPRLEKELAAVQSERLEEFVRANAYRVVRSREELRAEMQAREVDVLYLFCSAERDGFQIAEEVITGQELRDLLRGTRDGEPVGTSLLLLNVCRGSAADLNVLASLHAVGVTGFVAPELPLPADWANAQGLDLLAAFLHQGEPLGKIVQQLCARADSTSLWYTAMCSPALRVASASDGDQGASDSAPATQPLPETPYRALVPYDMEDRALFAGRDGDVERFSEVLDQADTRLLILHGPSGVGKASLLRAGVVPYLEEDCVGYRFLRDRSETEDSEADESVLAIRATHNLPGQLAQALCAFCARPYSFVTPTGRTVDVDLPAILGDVVRGERQVPPPPSAIVGQASSLAQSPEGKRGRSPYDVEAQGADAPRTDTPPDLVEGALRDDGELFARLMGALSERLPHEVILFIEQAEELFTIAKESTSRHAIDMLRRVLTLRGNFKVIVSLRTEFFGQLSDRLRGDERNEGAAAYLLRGLDENMLTEAILQPTAREPIPYADDIPFEKYGFAYDDGLAQEIARTAVGVAQEGRHSATALVQVACAQLAEIAQTRADRIVHLADLKTIGGVEGALDRYVGLLIDSPSHLKADRRAMRRLLPELLGRQPGGVLCRRLVPESVLDEQWKGASRLANVVDAAADASIGLLDTTWLKYRGRQERFVSLSHDALLPAAARLAEENERRIHTRKHVIDTLFITVPCILLALMLAYVFHSWYRAAASTNTENEKELAKGMQLLKSKEETLQSARWTGYVARLGQARQAWDAGNIVGLEQALRASQDVMKDESDLRGFEWYYLWRLGHSERATLTGHQGLITSVALSPDGKLIATASQDGTVKLWDAASGQERATLTAPEHAGRPEIRSTTPGISIRDLAAGPRGPVNAVAFSGDGSLVASGDANGIIRLWDPRRLKDEYVRSEKPISILRALSGPIRAMAFAPDGKTLAAAGSEKNEKTATNVIRLWDVKERKETKMLAGHKGLIHTLAFAPKGSVLASAGEDRTVVLWDTAQGEKRKTIEGLPGAVYAVTFSPDGKTLAAGGADRKDGTEVGAVSFWDTETGKERGRLAAVPACVFALAFLPDGKELATGTRSSSVQVWDIASGKERHTFKGHLGWVSALAVSPESMTLVTGSYDRTARIWDLATPANPQVLAGGSGWVCSVAAAPSGTIVRSGYSDGSIKLWDAITGVQGMKEKDHTGAVTALAFSAKGQLLASGSWDEGKGAGELLLRDVWPGEKPRRLAGHAGGISCLAFAPDGRTLASGGADHKVIFWDAKTGQKKAEIAAHDGVVRCVAFSPEGDVLATGGDDTRIRLWDAATGKEHATRDPENQTATRTAPLEEHTAAVLGLAFSPDSQWLASASADTTVKLWEVASGTAQITLRGHNGPVFSVSFSPGGETLASGGWDGTVKLWDPNRGTERYTLTGHTGAVRAVAFSPDRQLLASGSHDGTVRLWRAAPPEPIMMVPPAE